MVPVLALGFVVHISYALYLTLANRRARGTERYAVANKGKASSWASRNMFVLGIIILGLLGIHLTHFWANMQLQHFISGTAAENPYELVVLRFSQPFYACLYIVWISAIWFHLTHGFWSAFQSIGVNNGNWLPRLQVVATLFATVVALIYISIPLFFVCGLNN